MWSAEVIGGGILSSAAFAFGDSGDSGPEGFGPTSINPSGGGNVCRHAGHITSLDGGRAACSSLSRRSLISRISITIIASQASDTEGSGGLDAGSSASQDEIASPITSF